MKKGEQQQETKNKKRDTIHHIDASSCQKSCPKTKGGMIINKSYTSIICHKSNKQTNEITSVVSLFLPPHKATNQPYTSRL
jgi:hypothetical protein